MKTAFVAAILGAMVVSCSEAPKAPNRSGLLPPIGDQGSRWGAALMGLGRRGELVTVLGPIEPNRPAAIAKCAAAESSLGRNHRMMAAREFREAIGLDPTYAAAFEGLARCLIPEGELDWAEPLLRTALRFEPQFGRAKFELGACASMRGDFERALTIWQELERSEPDYPDLYARLAIACHTTGDHGAAVRYLHRADLRGQRVPSQFRSLIEETGGRS